MPIFVGFHTILRRTSIELRRRKSSAHKTEEKTGEEKRRVHILGGEKKEKRGEMRLHWRRGKREE